MRLMAPIMDSTGEMIDTLSHGLIAIRLCKSTTFFGFCLGSDDLGHGSLV